MAICPTVTLNQIALSSEKKFILILAIIQIPTEEVEIFSLQYVLYVYLQFILLLCNSSYMCLHWVELLYFKGNCYMISVTNRKLSLRDSDISINIKHQIRIEITGNILFIQMYKMITLFSSHETKSQVSFIDHTSSVIVVRRRSSVC